MNKDVPVDDASAKRVSKLTDKPDTSKPVSDDILKVISKPVYEKRVFSSNIRTELAERWSDILKQGLAKEELKDLIKKYPPPGNCTAIDPPKLNPELKLVLKGNSSVLNRDSRIMGKQEKITACLGAIGMAVSSIINNQEKCNNIEVLDCLNETSRILVDLQRDESLIRRNLIMSHMNISLKETLQDINSDEFLFGSKLKESLKAAKTMETACKDLKQISKNLTCSKQPSKNFRGRSRPAKSREYSEATSKNLVILRRTNVLSAHTLGKPIRKRRRIIRNDSIKYCK